MKLIISLIILLSFHSFSQEGNTTCEWSGNNKPGLIMQSAVNKTCGGQPICSGMVTCRFSGIRLGDPFETIAWCNPVRYRDSRGTQYACPTATQCYDDDTLIYKGNMDVIDNSVNYSKPQSRKTQRQ